MKFFLDNYKASLDIQAERHRLAGLEMLTPEEENRKRCILWPIEKTKRSRCR